MTTTQLVVISSESTLTVLPSSGQSTLHTTWPLKNLEDIIVHVIEARVSETTAVGKAFRADLQCIERLQQSIPNQAFMEKLLKSNVLTSPTA